MPSARPQLVEEGEPIRHRSDDSDDHRFPAGSRQVAPPHETTSRGTAARKGYVLTTKITIGEEQQDDIARAQTFPLVSHNVGPTVSPPVSNEYHYEAKGEEGDDSMILDEDYHGSGIRPTPSQAGINHGAATSLASAAGSSPGGRKNRIQTRLVVGGEAEDAVPSPQSEQWHHRTHAEDHPSGGVLHPVGVPLHAGFGGPSVAHVPELQHFPHPYQSSETMQHHTHYHSNPAHWQQHGQHKPASDSVTADTATADSHSTLLGEGRMEVEDIVPREPLVVLDGANVAYAYGDAKAGNDSMAFMRTGGGGGGGGRGRRRMGPDPDVRGIYVAARYFLSGNCRVQIVLPSQWMRAKPRDGDESRENAKMVTPQLEFLNELKSRGLVCAVPPTDDDDAYALDLAQREDTRAKKRRGGGAHADGMDDGGGFVLSNDLFWDASQRMGGGDLRRWLDGGSGNGPGRISYSFCDMGSMDEFGDRELDFVPNPNHALIARINAENRAI